MTKFSYFIISYKNSSIQCPSSIKCSCLIDDGSSDKKQRLTFIENKNCLQNDKKNHQKDFKGKLIIYILKKLTRLR